MEKQIEYAQKENRQYKELPEIIQRAIEKDKLLKRIEKSLNK